MTAKFLLTLLSLNGLLLGLTSAAQATDYTNNRNVTHLGQSISRTIGFDRDTDSLVEIAIDRALIAQQVNSNTIPMPTGGIPIATPPDSQQSDKKPIIIGEIAAPIEPKIGQSKRQKPTSDRQQPAGGIIKIKKK